MFQHVAIALDRTPESARAFEEGLDLAARLHLASVFTVTVKEPLSGFLQISAITDPSAVRTLQDDLDRFYQELIEGAVRRAATYGIELRHCMLEGDRVDRIAEFVSSSKIDLLVVGLHKSALRTHSLWSTVYSLAQGLTCSMLGVH